MSALAATPPSGTKLMSGNAAPARPLAMLPDSIARPLEHIRATFYYASTEDVLRNPSKPWAPRFPFAQASDKDRQHAARLQSAFSSALAMSEGSLLSDRARVAMEGHLQAFGYAITQRHAERLLSRTIERDRGA